MKLFVNACNGITTDTNPLENLQHFFDTITEIDEAIINEFFTKGAAMFQLAINIKAAKACLLNFKDVVENILKDEPSTTQQSFCQNPTNENFMKWAKASTLMAKKDIKSSPAKKSLSQILQTMRQTQSQMQPTQGITNVPLSMQCIDAQQTQSMPTNEEDPFLQSQSSATDISSQDQAIISNQPSTSTGLTTKTTAKIPISSLAQSSDDDDLIPFPLLAFQGKSFPERFHDVYAQLVVVKKNKAQA